MLQYLGRPRVIVNHTRAILPLGGPPEAESKERYLLCRLRAQCRGRLATGPDADSMLQKPQSALQQRLFPPLVMEYKSSSAAGCAT